MKNVAIVGTVGIPACYGGFETLVENLTKNNSGNVEYTVFCSEKSYENKLYKYNNARLRYISLSANGIESIFYDIFSLLKCFRMKPDVTLILGVSGCIFLPIYKLVSKSKIITNIDGLEWRRDKWSNLVKTFLKFSEKMAVKYSDVIICDNQAIGNYVTNEYKKENIVIAYGGDHVLIDNVVVEYSCDYYFSVCRIEPENNVELILKSFTKSSEKIKFVGNWGASEFGVKLKNNYGSHPNIELIDPIYDIAELYKLRSACKGYIHGHSAGGTNPSLVEAMHFSVPILAFDCDFNRFTTENKALYFSSSDSLKNLIDNEGDAKFSNCGSKMKGIATEKYKWDKISNQYESLY